MVSRWTLLALLFASITINLLDRQVLSVMAPRILEDLHINATGYSNIVFAFTLGLTLAQFPAGLWLDRKGARFGLPAIMLVWSAANALHGVARNVAHFATFRFLLGAAECGNYSAGVKVIAQHFPPHERALAGGLFNSGTVIGAFLAPPVLVWISSHYGWRMTFLFPSILGLLWIVPWVILYRDAPRPAAERRIAFAPLLRLRQVWGVMLMRALAGPVIHFYWYWLPEYLKRERGFSMEMIGLLAGLPFLFGGLGNIAGGSFAALLMRRGWSADRTRKTAWAIGALLCAASMLVPLTASRGAAIALICTATFGLASLAANNIGVLTDIFPARITAGVTGLTGLCEGVFNMFFTLATGRIVDAFSFLPVFIGAGLLPALAAAALFLIVRRVEPLEDNVLNS
ncbi:MAG: MFS transporter [Bryobacteraceae bacterium]